ncbi:response regulator transcription factor [Chroococcidiopsis cubana]|nr:response regulator transcription factor [Chroococcidiopsis cubana]
MISVNPIQILIAEDHAVVRQGIAAIISDEPDMNAIAQARDGQQAIDLYRLHQPDVVLMDLQMPKVDGVTAIASIKAEFPNACLLVLTTYDGDEDIYRGLQAGARGYLLKDATAEELLDAIRVVHQGRKYIPPQVAAKLAERFNNTELTEREIEVLQLLVLGKSNLEIGNMLGITERTAKFHVNNILHKLGVSDRTQAVIHALKRGLARLDT